MPIGTIPDMAQAEGDDPWSSIPARESLKSRLDSLKPYESMSWGELIHEMADSYEQES